MVPVDDCVAMAEAIIKLLNDERLELNIGLKGRKLAEEKLNLRKFIKQRSQVYKNV